MSDGKMVSGMTGWVTVKVLVVTAMTAMTVKNKMSSLEGLGGSRAYMTLYWKNAVITVMPSSGWV